MHAEERGRYFAYHLRMSPRVLLLLAALVTASCTKRPPPTSADAGSGGTGAPGATDGGSAAPSASARAETSSSAQPTSSSVPPLADTGNDDDPFGARALVGAPGSAIVVYAKHDASARKSDIFARPADADGRWRGGPRFLRRTSGRVAGIDVVRHDDVVWIAWTSQLDDRATTLTAAIKTNGALSSISSPVTLAQERQTDGAEGYWIRALALPDGGVVVAARALGLPVKCMFKEQEKVERCRAPGYKVSRIASDGTVTLLAHRAVDGNPLEMAPLVDIGGAVVVRAWAWHGGAVTDEAVLPYDAAAKEKTLGFGRCRPPFGQAWTGDTYVMTCFDDYLEKGEKCPVATGSDVETCARVLRTPIDGGAPVRRGTLVREIKDACVDGHPVLRVIAADGSRFVVDPSKPGASVPGFGGWTGKALLALNALEDQSEGPLRIDRRVCRGGELVEAPVP